jgi:hypothetical protein
MIEKPKQKSLFKAVIAKASLKQEVYSKTFNAFNNFKSEVLLLVQKYHESVKPGKWNIPFEFKDHGPFEFELKFGGDILIFFMHTNVFEFPRDHEVMKTVYIRDDKSRSYCGILHIFNFLGDSFKYNRTNDLGYLIGRLFINRENHYFVEGKREIGLLYNNFATAILNKNAIQAIVKSSIMYTLNFDLLTPPFDNVKEVTVQDMKTTLDNIQMRTGKRVGFRFQADQFEETQSEEAP